MNSRSFSLVSILILVTLLPGCYGDPNTPEFPVSDVQGYRPVYIPLDKSAISFQSPRSLKHPGKIYIIGRYLLINEKNEGIHVYDNNDPSHPLALGFLHIPGNTEIAVRNDILYVNHLSDLVALNVSNWQAIQEVSRIQQKDWASVVPPGSQRYFECVEPGKGYVIGWDLVLLKNPKCFH